jgi:succinate-semialdehyde dehydrogenase/glutarate-semialdehyde dehydrogenase
MSQRVSTPYPSSTKMYLAATRLVVLTQLQAGRRRARKDI